MYYSSSSSSSKPITRHHVYTSFHTPDLCGGFLSLLDTYFSPYGITTFKDRWVERGQTIGPETVRTIRESRISIVVLSPKYASSRWCLDELFEIFNTGNMIVKPIFYQVGPTLVRTIYGQFGREFIERTCQGESEETKNRWSSSLAHVGSLHGQFSENWNDEAAMVASIAMDVSLILYV